MNCIKSKCIDYCKEDDSCFSEIKSNEYCRADSKFEEIEQNYNELKKLLEFIKNNQ